MTWLDLSFNQITKLEGLSKLTKLTDLSLFNNKLDKIENIQALQDLVVLSLGKALLQLQAMEVWSSDWLLLCKMHDSGHVCCIT